MFFLLKGRIGWQQEPELPVVISSGLRYLPTVYYAPQEFRRRLFTLVDPRAAVSFAGTDSVDLGLIALRRYFPLQVEDYQNFASEQQEFLLVSGDGDDFDWLPTRLTQEGHLLNLIAIVNEAKIYKVTLKGERKDLRRHPSP